MLGSAARLAAAAGSLALAGAVLVKAISIALGPFFGA